MRELFPSRPKPETLPVLFVSGDVIHCLCYKAARLVRPVRGITRRSSTQEDIFALLLPKLDRSIDFYSVLFINHALINAFFVAPLRLSCYNSINTLCKWDFSGEGLFWGCHHLLVLVLMPVYIAINWLWLIIPKPCHLVLITSHSCGLNSSPTCA